MQLEEHQDAEEPRASSAPRRRLPPGACDCHIHVSDGTGRFAIHRRTHAPVHAPWSVQQKMRRETGLSRTVGVQLMAYGQDNSALLEALHASEGSMRGLAEVSPDVTDAELEQLHRQGVRGLRFYLEPPRPVPGIEITGVDPNELYELAPRLAQLGWCAEISAGCELLAKLGPELARLPLPIVFEHMAGCTAGQGLGYTAVQRVMELVRDHPFWVKLTACAMSQNFPDYEDLRPIHDSFVALAPDRVVWGSNWPHAIMGASTPDSGHLLDLLDEWIDHDDDLRRQILADNPARLFDFQE